jgi:DNA repair protein RadC
MNQIKSEEPAKYEAHQMATEIVLSSQDQVIANAINILEGRLKPHSELMSTPSDAQKYLFLKLCEKPAEVFCCLFLDNRHRVIEFREMFQGTIDGASVHPREIVRACIEVNAAAVIIAHNHPSGEPEPSRADITLTKRLVDSLALIDVRVLDHHIIGHQCRSCVSFAERGLI